MIGASDTQVVTADIAVGESGKPTRVFQVTWLSGGTAGVLILRNGTSTSGDIYFNQTGTINKTVTVQFGEEGTLFPAGCFADVDANVTRALITYRKEEA